MIDCIDLFKFMIIMFLLFGIVIVGFLTILNEIKLKKNKLKN